MEQIVKILKEMEFNGLEVEAQEHLVSTQMAVTKKSKNNKLSKNQKKTKRQILNTDSKNSTQQDPQK